MKGAWRRVVQRRSGSPLGLSGRTRRIVLLFLQPIGALCAPRLYVAVSKAPPRSGFGYLLYLGSLCGVVATILLAATVLKVLDADARWIAPRLPRLTLTADGVVTRALQPYEVARGNQVFLRVDTRREAQASPPRLPGRERPPLVTITRRMLTVTPMEPFRPMLYGLAPETPEERDTWNPYQVDCCSFLRDYRWYRNIALLAAFLLPMLLVCSLTLALTIALCTLAWPLCRIVRSRASWRALWNMAARASTAALVILAFAAAGLLPRTLLTVMSSFLLAAGYLALGVRWAR